MNPPARPAQPGAGWRDLASEIQALERAGLRRSLREAAGLPLAECTLDGRPMVNFGSNNYLGLATHPEVIAAAQEAAGAEGTGTGASRLLSGNQSGYRRLEATLADWKGTESALVFSSGFAAAVGAIPALAGPGDAVACDRLAHASLLDGARLSRARLLVYPHADPAALDRVLARQRRRFRRVLVVTDGLFSMDGDICPLPELIAVAERHDARLLVDDAHATGVLGGGGGGTLEHFGVAGVDRVVQMGTLSKALGSAGGFIAGPDVLREWLVNRARTLVFSTGVPASSLAAAGAAVGLARRQAWRRTRLRELSVRVRGAARAAGLVVPEGDTPVIPVMLGDEHRAMRWMDAMLARGLFVPGVRPPTVPAGGSRLRISLMATHTDEHAGRLVETLAAFAGREPS
ncbi:MAG: 8-amino-7-oxononanoate synthase [Candidatus Coatesbacteria bacterium]